MILQECQTCGYKVYICYGVKLFEFCPECDSPNMKVVD